MACSIILTIASRMDYIDRILPAEHTDRAHAIIELLALVAGIASGYLKASPLNISDKGREKYRTDTIRLRPRHADD